MIFTGVVVTRVHVWPGLVSCPPPLAGCSFAARRVCQQRCGGPERAELGSQGSGAFGYFWIAKQSQLRRPPTALAHRPWAVTCLSRGFERSPPRRDCARCPSVYLLAVSAGSCLLVPRARASVICIERQTGETRQQSEVGGPGAAVSACSSGVLTRTSGPLRVLRTAQVLSPRWRVSPRSD